MKRLFTFICFCFLASADAQQLSPQVIASAGDYFEQNNGSLSWTLGEIEIETINDANNTLTQGFQQSNFNVVSVRNLNNIIEFIAFPNPTNDFVTIRALQTGEVLMELFDLQGRIILTRHFVGQNDFQINMNDLATGLYMIKLTTLSNALNKTFKIQKI